MGTDIFRKRSLVSARFFRTCQVDGERGSKALFNPAAERPLVAFSSLGRIVHRWFPAGRRGPRQRVFSDNSRQQIASHEGWNRQFVKYLNYCSGNSLNTLMTVRHGWRRCISVSSREAKSGHNMLCPYKKEETTRKRGASRRAAISGAAFATASATG